MKNLPQHGLWKVKSSRHVDLIDHNHLQYLQVTHKIKLILRILHTLCSLSIQLNINKEIKPLQFSEP